MKINLKNLLPLIVTAALFMGIQSISKGQQSKAIVSGHHTFNVPSAYFEEREDIPPFWITSVDDVSTFLYNTVKKGRIDVIGKSVGGRFIRSVTYGTPRQGKGTTTFSGALGFRDVKAYRGNDHDKKVYMSIAAVHGGEFEGIIGMVNLISVIET